MSPALLLIRSPRGGASVNGIVQELRLLKLPSCNQISAWSLLSIVVHVGASANELLEEAFQKISINGCGSRCWVAHALKLHSHEQASIL